MFVSSFVAPNGNGFIGNPGRNGPAAFDFENMSAGEITAAGWVTDENGVRTLGRPINTPFSPIIRATTGTDEGADQCAACWSISSGGYARIIRKTATNKIRLQVVKDGVTVCDIDAGAVADNTLFVLGARIATDNFGVLIDGQSEVTDTSGTPPPNISLWTVGAHRDGTLLWTGTVWEVEVA